MNPRHTGKRSFLRFLKNKYVIAAIIIVILIAYMVSRGGSKSAIESATAIIGSVSERVGVTGKISPVDKADLSFEKSGVITNIYVKVGDEVKRGDVIASLESAGDRAALASAQATLADTARALTPQELAVQKTALDNARKDALNAAHDGYAKAQGAVVNYADQFFSNPQSSNPVIQVRTDSQIARTDMGNERLAVSGVLSKWSAELSASGTSDPVSLISHAREYLNTIKSFMNNLSTIINALNPGNSGMTQSAIDADVAAINIGLSNVNAAIDTVTTAQGALSTAQSNYDLRLSGNSAQSISAQAAKVAGAQAELDKDRLLSPIDGLITRIDPHVGEFVSPGTPAFGVISQGAYKIEAYVPEADIAKVRVSNIASTTLDAYGQAVDFPATVVSVDPAETVLEGVPTYKVTLQFLVADERIRSGMTANLEILTNQHDNVLTIPTRAVVDDNGVKTVRVLKADGKTFSSVPVTVGLKGSDGTIEIVSGITEGEKVVTYVK